jgi:hypothetical protein
MNMNVIVDDKKDADRERDAIRAERSPFSESVSYGKDRDSDGDVDFQDLPDYDAATERIFAPVEDDRAEIRRLKSLKAQDILEERRRQREEIAADAILKEAERERALAARSSARKMIDNAAESIADKIRNIHLPAPAPERTRVRRSAVPRGRAQVRPMNVVNPNAPVPLGRNTVNNFAESMLPRRRIVAPSESNVRVRGSPKTTNYQAAQGLAGSMFLGNVMGGAHKPKRDNPVLNDKSQGMMLKDFTANLLGGSAKSAKPISFGNVGISTSVKPKKNAVQKFASSVLIGGKSKKKGKSLFGGF